MDKFLCWVLFFVCTFLKHLIESPSKPFSLQNWLQLLHQYSTSMFTGMLIRDIVDVICCTPYCTQMQKEDDTQQKDTLLSQVLQEPARGAKPHHGIQQQMSGGYECEFVKRPESAFQLECPICMLVLRDPYQAKCCGTSFCHLCSTQIQDDQKPCPVCRKDNFELFQNKGMKHSLNQLQVFCTYRNIGCKWSGELGELEHHLKEVIHSGETG